MGSANQASSGTGSVTPDQGEGQQSQQRRLVVQVGPLEIEWPKAVGYYGGLGLAIAVGLVEPPIALFVAAVPLFKALNRPNSSQAEWIAGQVLEGASTPVGGSASPVIRVTSGGGQQGGSKPSNRLWRPAQNIWRDARALADKPR